jgi:hypothetical protein
MKVGEIWAFRDRAGSKAARVQIEELGKRKSPRVTVAFLDAPYEGEERKVKTSQLIVFWSALGRVDAETAALRDLISQGQPDDALSSAIDTVEQMFLAHGAYIHTRSVEWGLLTTNRPDLLATDAQLTVAEVTKGAWWHDGTCTIPLPTTKRVMAALAHANAQEVLRYVEAEEECAALKMKAGEVVSKTYISPEVASAVYEELTGPYLQILRDWAGSDQEAARDEVRRWKTHAWEMYALLAETVDQLKRDGHEDTAWRIHRRLHPGANRRSWTPTRELERVRAEARDRENFEEIRRVADERQAELARRTAELEAEIWSDAWRPPLGL